VAETVGTTGADVAGTDLVEKTKAGLAGVAGACVADVAETDPVEKTKDLACVDGAVGIAEVGVA
jgi:hypothetical protein